jgi:hypothetical protein
MPSTSNGKVARITGSGKRRAGNVVAVGRTLAGAE